MRKKVKHDQDVMTILDTQIEIQDIFDSYADNVTLPWAVAIHVLEVGNTHLATYARLAIQADADVKLLWKTLPKHHWMWHLFYRCRYLHPRAGSCASDEDFVGRHKKIVCACSSGYKLF